MMKAVEYNKNKKWITSALKFSRYVIFTFTSDNPKYNSSIPQCIVKEEIIEKKKMEILVLKKILYLVVWNKTMKKC